MQCNIFSQAQGGPTVTHTQAQKHTNTHTHTRKRPASLKHKHTPCGRGGLASASSYYTSPRFPRPLPSNPQQAFYLTAARFPLSSPTLRPPLSQPLLRHRATPRRSEKVSASLFPPPSPFLRPSRALVCSLGNENQLSAGSLGKQPRRANSRTHMQRLPHVRSQKKKRKPVWSPRVSAGGYTIY